MREIGALEREEDARLFSDFLFGRGIDNETRRDGAGHWALWIRSENDVASAKELLSAFRAAPDSPEYRLAVGEGERVRREREEQEEEALKRLVNRKQIFSAKGKLAAAPLTLLLVVTSCLVSLPVIVGGGGELEALLSISRYAPPEAARSFWEGLVEVRGGEVWRLVTPIFLHFSILHILFNMMWLHDLGGGIERTQGWQRLAMLVLAIAVLSNTAQYIFEGPRFGGMSGVVYGLFGYVWILCRYDSGCRLGMPRSTIVVMLIWYFICWTGLVGPIANVAHTAGLALGMLWGWASAGTRK